MSGSGADPVEPCDGLFFLFVEEMRLSVKHTQTVIECGGNSVGRFCQWIKDDFGIHSAALRFSRTQ